MLLNLADRKSQSALKIDLNVKIETNHEENEIVDKNKGVLKLNKMFEFGEIIVTNLMNFIDTIFCLKNKLKKIECYYNAQILEAFICLNNCIRLSFFCFCIFFVLNLYTFYHNISRIDLVLKRCSFGFVCTFFISFMDEPDNIVFLFILCLIIYITIMFVYILYLLLRFFINKSESDFIENRYVFSSMLFTSPTLRLTHAEDRVNFRQYMFICMFKIRESFKM